MTHRASRYFDSSKTQRDNQKRKESRRSSTAFTLRKPKSSKPMTQYSCDICGLQFGTTWLDHCPSCGSRSLSIVIDLSLLVSEEV